MKIGTVDPTLLEKNLTKRIEEDVRLQRVCGAAVAVYLKNSCYDGGSGSLTGKHFEEDIYNSIL